MTPQPRSSAGTPTGGQFAAKTSPEADVELEAPIGEWAEAGWGDESARDWVFHGFTDPHHAQDWEEAGFKPVTAREFRDAGFSAEQAFDWDDRSISAALARAYVTNGVRTGLVAADFVEARIEPEAAGHWSRMLVQHGIEDEYTGVTAGDWDHQGFTPQAAEVWVACGIDRAADAKNWNLHGFEPVEAAAWREQHFSPEESKRWVEAGCTPDEADYFAVRGISDNEARHELANSRTQRIAFEHPM